LLLGRTGTVVIADPATVFIVQGVRIDRGRRRARGRDPLARRVVAVAGLDGAALLELAQTVVGVVDELLGGTADADGIACRI
jgi:hypothetical protein